MVPAHEEMLTWRHVSRHLTLNHSAYRSQYIVCTLYQILHMSLPLTFQNRVVCEVRDTTQEQRIKKIKNKKGGGGGLYLEPGS
jgi:hypothetical protein